MFKTFVELSEDKEEHFYMNAKYFLTKQIQVNDVS
jgi:hypothetical protein